MSDHAGFVFEADYDGARFDELESRGRVSAGVNWSPLPHGTLRAALTAGLADASPDAQLIVGFALTY